MFYLSEKPWSTPPVTENLMTTTSPDWNVSDDTLCGEVVAVYPPILLANPTRTFIQGL